MASFLYFLPGSEPVSRETIRDFGLFSVLGASYQTAQDNVSALALNLTNFNTVWTAARKHRDDQGNYYNFVYDLLVVGLELVVRHRSCP